ncbi:putative transcription factor CG1-CAMTA family [Rosa chinensis]|uniref:Putative transcription factor CG1-CAMTA family n=1 Tax=Rosa chinensis TaxID=74649 RepID=A0A2P6RQC6_ROSCH|nr:calmodulin-binding transcription activator 2 isoform X3 [Rosa chinensis]PRQ48646.1 putative transcription factor CG1-CAMTA family [Rosa chinensis]
MAESQRLLGGSLFLVDRKKVKHYKRDGHNWRKKKDGKTVMEGNEKLKVGHVHKLRCYYAPGEENKNFKRRIYSMLEEDLKHIVLVHYREEESTSGVLLFNGTFLWHVYLLGMENNHESETNGMGEERNRY